MKEAISVNFQNPAFRPIESQGTASGFCESKQKEQNKRSVFGFSLALIKNKKERKINIDNNEEFDPGSG